MGVQGGPEIITDELSVVFDIANSKSYISGSNTVEDLDEKYTLELNNNPGFSSANKGSLVLDGSDDYLESADSAFGEFAVDNSSVSPSGIKWTTESWVNFGEISGNQYIYYISNDAGTLVTYLFVNGNGRLQAFISGSSSNWTRSGNGVIAQDNWYQISVVYDSTVSRYSRQKIFVNGAKATGHTSNFYAANSFASEKIKVGTNFAENSPMSGSWSNMKIYQKALSTDEIFQNYNELKGRFGL
jgi:hypothetical protein